MTDETRKESVATVGGGSNSCDTSASDCDKPAPDARLDTSYKIE